MQTVHGEICPDSYGFVHTGSAAGRSTFFYPLCAGSSHIKAYSISRTSFDSYLIMFVNKGTLFVKTDDREMTAGAGDAVLLDCYRPYSYGTHSECTFRWVHFDGPQAKAYYDIASSGGPVFHPENPQRLHHDMEQLLEIFRKKQSRREADLSCRIVMMLTELMDSCSGEKEQDAVEIAVGLINENPSADLTLNAMADYVSLSPWYFCHLFRQKMGVTPHEYLLQVRVDRARYLLKFTDLPLKAVAESCGFSDPSSFSNTFRRLTGTTPLSCRMEDTV